MEITRVGTIKEIQKHTGSLTKALDIFYVLKSVKKVARILVKEGDKNIIDFFEKSNLKFVYSNFKIVKKVDKNRSYADLGCKVCPENKKEGDYLLYISNDKDLAIKARDFEDSNNHKILGRILDYPECCVDFFMKYLEEVKDLDYTPLSFLSSTGINFSYLINNCLRGYDYSIISHFPCSFQCEKSIILSKKYLDLINADDEVLGYHLVTSLKKPVIYSPGLGVYYFNADFFEGQINYKPGDLIYQSNNSFTSLLKSEQRIRVLDMHNFLVGSTRVSDKKTYFGNFS